MVRVLVCALILFVSSASFAADCGRFRVVKGEVTFKGKGQSDFEKARINKQVCQGDTVKTGADSRAKIVMADQNELNISPDSELLVEVYDTAQADGEKKVLLNVIYGKIRSNVKQKYKDDARSHYRVKTKSAVAGVRGTEFLTSFDRATSETKVVTFEGEVSVGKFTGGNFIAEVTVKPGQFTSNNSASRPHPPQNIPTEELAKMDSESGGGSSSRGVSNEPAAKPDSSDKKEEPADEKKQDSGSNKESNGNKDQASKGGGDRSPASAKPSLPPPSLPPLPKLPPTTTILNLPPIPQVPPDVLLNGKKSKVIIVPRLPGQ